MNPRLHSTAGFTEEIISLIWLPLLIWTLLAGGLLLLARWRVREVEVQYRGRLALLASLPGGVLLSIVLYQTTGLFSAEAYSTETLKFIVLSPPLEITLATSDLRESLSSSGLFLAGAAIWACGVMVLAALFLRQLMQLGALCRKETLRQLLSLDTLSEENRKLALRRPRLFCRLGRDARADRRPRIDSARDPLSARSHRHGERGARLCPVHRKQERRC